jgi:hypothetical protein
MLMPSIRAQLVDRTPYSGACPELNDYSVCRIVEPWLMNAEEGKKGGRVGVGLRESMQARLRFDC